MAQQYKRSPKKIQECLVKTAAKHDLSPKKVADILLIDYFEKLPGEIVELILLNMNSNSLIHFCSVSLRIRSICENHLFRMRRLRERGVDIAIVVQYEWKSWLHPIARVYGWTLHERGVGWNQSANKLIKELDIHQRYIIKRQLAYRKKWKEDLDESYQGTFKIGVTKAIWAPIHGEITDKIYTLFTFSMIYRSGIRLIPKGSPTKVLFFFSKEDMKKWLIRGYGILSLTGHQISNYRPRFSIKKIIPEMMESFEKGQPFLLPLKVGNFNKGTIFVLSILDAKGKNMWL